MNSRSVHAMVLTACTMCATTCAGVGPSLLHGDCASDIREVKPCNILAPIGEGTYASNLWPAGIIPFEFDANVSMDNQALALAAMAEIEQVCGLDFVERAAQEDYIHIQDADGNSSWVGMQGGRQEANIFNWNWHFIICHELMHAAGLWHEHQRPDRDSVVQINWDNIEAGREHNFTVPHDAMTHLGYDLDSVMHYGQFAFSNNGEPTITVLPPNEGWQELIGQRTHLSDGDIQVLEELYTQWDGPYRNPDNGNDYYVSRARMSPVEADLQARRFGGHLVTINDAAENDWVLTTLVDSENCWIGLWQADGSNEPDEGWYWRSGQLVEYRNWDWQTGEPNNADGVEEFAEMRHQYANGRWNDARISAERRAIVEIAACPADFTGDGSVDTRDVIAFLNAWNAGEVSADFNHDETVNTIDVIQFLNAWAAGC